MFYIAQCGIGMIIHWVKPKDIRYRPPQNYMHAIFGILIMTLALYQVRTGYHVEGPMTIGRELPPGGMDVFWIWVNVSVNWKPNHASNTEVSFSYSLSPMSWV